MRSARLMVDYHLGRRFFGKMPAHDALTSRYKLGKKLGRGSHGDVFLGTDKETGEEVAIKVGKEIGDVQAEVEIYQEMQAEGESPRILMSGVDMYGRDFMVMDLLGPNLGELFCYCNKQFDLKTTLMLADQLISLLEFVHSKGFVHRSVKPENFVMGSGAKAKKVKIIDFCSAIRYCDRSTGSHIPYCESSSTNALFFTSMSAHLGAEKTRRDDLESVGYMLMYFLRGSLPWQSHYTGLTKTKKLERLRKAMLGTTIDSLCRGFPQEFAAYLKYCRSLGFDEQPDYNFLRQMFKDLFHREGFKRDRKYSWTLKALKENWQNSNLELK